MSAPVAASHTQRGMPGLLSGDLDVVQLLVRDSGTYDQIIITCQQWKWHSIVLSSRSKSGGFCLETIRSKTLSCACAASATIRQLWPQVRTDRDRLHSGRKATETMQEAAKNLLLVLVALFPIVDPLGGSPFFLALTREYAPEARKALSWRIAMNSFFLLIGSYFIGTYVLAFFGISLPVVQVGGGMIVIATGWTLLKQRDDEKHDVHRTVQPQDTFRQAFYPLTMPLTVGPGSISVAITLGANAAHHHSYHPLTILAALIGLVLIAISILLCYGFADRLARILGATGMTVITQLSSFFLVCIGVQIAWNGVKALLESVTFHFG
jgi:multiple antibiotic resistance protein